MADEKDYGILSAEQVGTLQSQGCYSGDWNQVKIAGTADLSSIRNVHFSGEVRIGDLSGTVKDIHGIEKPCGIYNAAIADCSIANRCRISGITVHIANYDIADNVCIENTGTVQATKQATFGNGVEVTVLNEAGGREVILFDRLNAQFAYLMCLYRYRPDLIEKLKAIADKYVQKVKTGRGVIGSGGRICGAGEIIDVRIGPYAVINGSSSLVNGTILSSQEAAAVIGTDVIAKDFIISEGSSVTEAALLDKVFVGQGCQIGKQFSASDSLFFASCEALHGEACSIFAGPYTVSHHKSTLLIAGLFSFFNAGSGTNQSNHMYKLGPVHEGKLLRGTKTGSFSYMMWPCRTGPFSVVLGKHTSTFDTADFPFSHLEARTDGKCSMVPGLHLTTAGTVRDGAKWPKRDRRKGNIKRDTVSFDIFSPYTVGKMIKANVQLQNLQQTSDKDIEDVPVGGALVKRPILSSSQKYYRTGINMYLLEKVVEKVRDAVGCGAEDISKIFAAEPDAVYSCEWVDIAGQLMGQKRLVELEEAIENQTIATIEDFEAQIQKISQAYQKDQWVWVKKTYTDVFGVDLGKASKKDIIDAAGKFLEVKSKFLNLVITDAGKEFSELSHCGFGQDGGDKDIEADFDQVRGLYEDNSFIKDTKEDVEKLRREIEQLQRKLLNL